MAYQTINPATGETIRRYDDATDADIQLALANADAAFRDPAWRDDIDRRLAVLRRLSGLLGERRDEIATLMATEMGKLVAEGVGEVKLCSAIAAYYAERSKDLLARVPYQSSAGDAWIEHHPVGVIVAIEPWNFPIYQLTRVIAPAIAVGNAVLFKHAENVPGCAELFEALVQEAGAPDGLVTNVFASNEQISDLIGDDRVQGVALTGSERAGAAVASRASEELKKATLELGGSDVFIVLDDADIDRAVKIGSAARLSNCGQVCTAAKRFILHEKVADAFLSALSERMQGVVMGDPLDRSTTLAPLSSKGAQDGLARQVEEAVAHGAELMFGGRPADRPGFFFEPGILRNVTRDNPVYRQELFGPVAQVFTVGSDDEAVELANDSRFGLGGAVFSRDVERATVLASRVETGMVFINSATGSLPELPFGGVKRSGFGKELGDLGIMEFVNRKLVVVAKSRKEAAAVG